MQWTVQELLEKKGIHVKEEHIPILEQRWEQMRQVRRKMRKGPFNDYDISLRNIPGGDHIE
ncbi:hypothetical protein GJS40_07690 [Aliibacillus thermotolerans]|nr:hypothetical protein [Aliibacillus thermotolerans]